MWHAALPQRPTQHADPRADDHDDHPAVLDAQARVIRSRVEQEGEAEQADAHSRRHHSHATALRCNKDGGEHERAQERAQERYSGHVFAEGSGCRSGGLGHVPLPQLQAVVEPQRRGSTSMCGGGAAGGRQPRAWRGALAAVGMCVGKGEKMWEKGETRLRRRASQATGQRVGAGGVARERGCKTRHVGGVHHVYDRIVEHRERGTLC